LKRSYKTLAGRSRGLRNPSRRVRTQGGEKTGRKKKTKVGRGEEKKRGALKPRRGGNDFSRGITHNKKEQIE